MMDHNACGDSSLAATIMDCWTDLFELLSAGIDLMLRPRFATAFVNCSTT
ncbi:hypothetical protein ABFT80_14915 [Mesorhizobium sp. SB112]